MLPRLHSVNLQLPLRKTRVVAICSWVLLSKPDCHLLISSKTVVSSGILEMFFSKNLWTF